MDEEYLVRVAKALKFLEGLDNPTLGIKKVSLLRCL